MQNGGILLLLTLSLIVLFRIPVYAGSGDAADPAASGSAASGPAAEPTATPLPPGKANLRLIYTSDSHGQITSFDYQRQTEVVRGLERVATMMETARDEVNNQNYMTFDIGDNIMDYTTDYIYNQSPTTTQPIYKVLASLGYDAITLGNHEFDYGINYVTRQLENSGLMDKCVLSNVTSKFTGDYVFGRENRIIEKEVIDHDGRTRIVKVGLFGVTPPTMSSRTENVLNSLNTESIYDASVREVAALKEQGADIIIALAHTGVGTENPSETASNAGYAMAHINGLDVILGGHQHVYFPDSNFSYLPDVDKRTWLIKGTRLMVMRDSARALGVIDLNLSFDADGKVRIDSSDYDIRKVTAKVEPNPGITSYMDSWGPKITKSTTKVIGSIGDNRWTTYLASLETNPILQTVQNAQRAYAYQYITENAPQYAELPILSATRYGMFGNESGNEYGDVSDKINIGRIQDFARYHQYIHVYEITGAQLKEWIEWSASVYQKPGTSSQSQWEDPIIARYARSGGNSLLTDENIREWKSMFLFGGIEYTINPTRDARYTKDGRKQSSSERVTSLTYNGTPIEPDQKFVIASDQILAALQCDATKGIYSNKIASKKILLQDVVKDYLTQRAAMGTIAVNTHQNWTIDFPTDYRFLLATGSGGDDVVPASKWAGQLYDSNNGYSYFECKAPAKETADTQGPNLTLVSSSYETSDSPVSVRVLTNDISGVECKRYIIGTRPADSEDWNNPLLTNEMLSDTVTFEKNGIYTFFVKDTVGNITTQSIAITTIDPETLKKPVVKKIDNNDTYVTGTAQIGATVNVRIGSKTYSDKADIDGEFIVEIPVQLAGTKISVYVSDSKERTSGKVNLIVKSVGPNHPTGKAYNNSYYITGKTNEVKANLYAQIGNKIYVSKKLGKGYYKSCKKYDSSKSIVKTTIKIKKNGSYSIKIPHCAAGKKLKVFTVDTLGRVSYRCSVTVKRKTFEPVSRYATYSSEKKVYGRIKEEKRGYIRAYYANGKFAGSGYSDKEGCFAVPVSRALKSGEVITLIAAKNGTTSVKSHPSKLTVENLKDVDEADDDLTIRKVTAKDKTIKGKCDYRKGQITVIAPGSSRTTIADSDGEWKLKMSKRYKEGTRLCVLVRTNHGNIIGMKKKTVLEAPPARPVIHKVYKNKLLVRVFHKEKLKKMVLKVGKTKYKTFTVKYSKKHKCYDYRFKVKSLEDDDKITATAKNKGGSTKSKPYWVS
ncbi:MAG: Ig-like domain-containing protein [Eubacterium sp.]|nr:Ig-like domain-containing protein [Eubacterium sp.]